MRSRTSQGFTLIEVLVALAIFGIMSVVAYQALGQALSNADLLRERAARLQALQRTVSMLGRDLTQATRRPVRNLIGQGFVPSMRANFESEFALEVTRAGWANPAGLPRSTLQRAAWRIEDRELLRYHWNVLDPTLSNEPVITALLDDVDSILFRYRLDSGDWVEQWPPLGVSPSNGALMLPQVVEVILTLPDEGELRRFFEVAR
jgi:general secretion pathway protein J